MSRPDPAHVTAILKDLESGRTDHEVATRLLFELIYGELRWIAGGLMKSERAGQTLQPTALVHEAYLRLVTDEKLGWQNRAHFFGVAARAMRQILVDNARRKSAAKRGGGWQRVTLHESIGEDQDREYQILELEDALTKLGLENERTARVAELRLFGGLKMTEIAHLLEMGRRTIQDDWRFAVMWLGRELAGGDST